jgi:hypothetical protein
MVYFGRGVLKVRERVCLRYVLSANGRSSVTVLPHSLPSRRSSALAALQAASQNLTTASWTEAMAVHRVSVANTKGFRA